MANKLPFYQMYVDDFDDDRNVVCMSLAEVGTYVLALNCAWRYGGIPDSPEQLALFIRKRPQDVKRAWPKVRRCFVPSDNGDGRLVNPRQEREREKAITKSERATNAALARHYGDESPIPQGAHRTQRQAGMAHARKQGTHTKSEWKDLLVATGNICVKCKTSEYHLEKDHIVPIRFGGSDSIMNIQPMCAMCNSTKENDRTDYRLSCFGFADFMRTHQSSIDLASTHASGSGSESESPKGSAEGEQPVSQLAERYHELLQAWPPHRTGVNLGAQVWLQFIDNGEITDANIHEIFEGLERWKSSETWTKNDGGYISAIAKPDGTGWLQQRKWRDYPKQAGEKSKWQ